MTAAAAFLQPHTAPLLPSGSSRTRLTPSRIAAVAAMVLAGAAAAWACMPLAARVVAERLPHAVSAQIGRSALRALDGSTFAPSRLTPTRQQLLRREFLNLKHPDGTFVMWRIEFRGGAKVGPNAFALPDSTIVVTDALVESARDDREIMAILAHEMGHMSGKHPLRAVLEKSPAGMLSALLGADAARLSAAAPEALLSARPTPSTERDADDFACRMMRANGISAAFPGNLISRLERREARPEEDGSVPDFFATHGSAADFSRRLGACQGALASREI